MKQIKFYLTITLLLIAFLANAQIKVHSDNHISIGSLTKQYGIQIDTACQVIFERRTNPNYSWVTVSQTTNNLSKCWIVRNPTLSNMQPFYVTGGGVIYSSRSLSLSDSRYQHNEGDIENPLYILNQMDGFYYTNIDDTNPDDNRNIKRRVGFSAQEIEKVFPEAVESDENGLLYLDYEAMTAFLVEALKEQQQEIENLRSVLKENGLLK